MGTIRTVEERMPPGFRFHPRDDELVLDYLLHKLSGRGHGRCGVAMADVDLNKCEPWDLPDDCCVGEGNEWYFFSLRDRKYTTGSRTNRATRSGYWKATGKDRAILAAADESRAVGMRKTLVFYRGRAPRGRKTEWVMHEFRLHPCLSRRWSELQLPAVVARHHRSAKEDWVLCRVFYKSRTTTPTRPPSQDQASVPSCQPGLPAVGPPATATATYNYNAFDDSQTTAEQEVSCFAGLPAMPFRRPAVSLGDLLAIDTSEKEAVGTMIGSTISSGLELAPSWEQENDLTQIWASPYNALVL